MSTPTGHPAFTTIRALQTHVGRLASRGSLPQYNDICVHLYRTVQDVASVLSQRDAAAEAATGMCRSSRVGYEDTREGVDPLKRPVYRNTLFPRDEDQLSGSLAAALSSKCIETLESRDVMRDLCDMHSIVMARRKAASEVRRLSKSVPRVKSDEPIFAGVLSLGDVADLLDEVADMYDADLAAKAEAVDVVLAAVGCVVVVPRALGKVQPHEEDQVQRSSLPELIEVLGRRNAEDGPLTIEAMVPTVSYRGSVAREGKVSGSGHANGKSTSCAVRFGLERQVRVDQSTLVAVLTTALYSPHIDAKRRDLALDALENVVAHAS